MSITVYIGLGSNLNNPNQQLTSALSALDQIPNTQLICYSHFYQTKPVGFLAQPDFLNAVAELETTLFARDLFNWLKKIEHDQGRVRNAIKDQPRTLDLDFLLYGQHTISEPDLIIPHPRMLERTFVLTPLQEIAPNLWLFQDK